MSVSPFSIQAAMSAAMRLRAEIGDSDDRLLLDCIEGQTDCLEIIDRLAEQSLADRLLVERAKARIVRIEARADRARATIQQMMEALGQKSLTCRLSTVSIADGPRAVVITDQAALPAVYWRRAPDKVLLGKDLKAGKEVPGAEMTNGTPTLRVMSR